jgi:hypothetical protein
MSHPPRLCGCLADDPHICIEERHRRWPRECADYFDGDACRCACHEQPRHESERRSSNEEARP